MHFISILLFAFSANIDNFTVGIAYGIKKIRIGFCSNLLIAIITAIGTFASMAIGLAVVKVLPEYIANAAGSMLLILIGIWIAKDFFFKHSQKGRKVQTEMSIENCHQILEKPEKADSDHSDTIDLRESFLLALALTINNFGLGIGASITGLNIIATVVCTFIFSLISIPLGCFLGKSCLSSLFGKYAQFVSGLIIIILGIYELLI